MAKQPNVERIIDAILSIIAESDLKSGEITPWSPIQQRLVENGVAEPEIMEALKHINQNGILEGAKVSGFVTLTEAGFQRIQLLDS